MSSTGVISAPCGPVQGFTDGKVNRYTGIPYAKADRFETPRPQKDWTTTFLATSPSPACPQLPDPLKGIIASNDLLHGLPTSEHCQNLSITTPADIKPNEKLSVMVWIHGGSFTNGAGDSPAYNPSHLVAEQRLIVVNVTYRLNLFGFLGGHHGDGTARPANLGLLDQLAALRWVKRNIAAFGGNDEPSSITLFGQSAGGSSVADLMACSEAVELFGRAIVQSAPFGITSGRERMNEALLAVTSDASPASTVEEILAFTARVGKVGDSWGMPGAMPFAPQYGHTPLPVESELAAALNKTAPKIDLLVGSTEHEASLFMDLLPWVKWAANLPLLGPFCYNFLVSRITASMYHQGCKAFAERHRNAGGKASLYRLGWAALGNKMGAGHTIELPLLLGGRDTWEQAALLKGSKWEDVEIVGKQLRGLWADFARGRLLDEKDGVNKVITIDRIGVVSMSN